jgi:hypothetical protein
MNTSHIKRSKKPKPLFGLFRSKNSSNGSSPRSPLDSSLGSGISTVPLNSMLSPKHDPYQPPPPPPPKPSTSTDTRKPQKQQTRQRSKSVGRDPSTNNTNLRILLEERENALNKLCKRDTTPTSLADSLPLLSPTYHKSPPPVPPIPLHHQQQPSMRKFSSAHDLRKAARLQQESIQQTVEKPMPKPQVKDISRSRSLSSPRLHASKSQQQLKSPTTPTRRRMIHVQNDSSDDDDIPLGYLQSPISKPSSLLNDLEEDDDKDLIPIAAAIQSNTSSKPEEKKEQYQTAADKYKERVKERLQFNQDSDDDDDVPISLTLLSPKDRTKKWKK